MSMKSIIAAAGLLLVTACGGGGTSISFTGTVRGQTFSPKETVSTKATIAFAGGSAEVGAVVLSDTTNTCSNATANKEAKNSAFFVILLAELSQQGKIVAPTTGGDFTVYSPDPNNPRFPPLRFAIVLSQKTGGDCKANAGLEGVGIKGNISVSSIANDAYEGTFKITLVPGDGEGNAQTTGPNEEVSGSFKASACPGLAGLVNPDRSTTCI